MPQLVDDLSRRDAALSRRARHKDMSAGPRGEIREGPTNADPATERVAVSSEGLSIDGTMPKM